MLTSPPCIMLYSYLNRLQRRESLHTFCSSATMNSGGLEKVTRDKCCSAALLVAENIIVCRPAPKDAKSRHPRAGSFSWWSQRGMATPFVVVVRNRWLFETRRSSFVPQMIPKKWTQTPAKVVPRPDAHTPIENHPLGGGPPQEKNHWAKQQGAKCGGELRGGLWSTDLCTITTSPPPQWNPHPQEGVSCHPEAFFQPAYSQPRTPPLSSLHSCLAKQRAAGWQWIVVLSEMQKWTKTVQKMAAKNKYLGVKINFSNNRHFLAFFSHFDFNSQ